MVMIQRTRVPLDSLDIKAWNRDCKIQSISLVNTRFDMQGSKKSINIVLSRLFALMQGYKQSNTKC